MTKKSNGHANGKPKAVRRGFIGYGSYMFKSKDPVVDELRTMVTDEYGKLNSKAFKAIENAGGPKVQTMRNWFFKGTMRPTNPAIEACGRAMGRKRVWVADRPNK